MKTRELLREKKIKIKENAEINTMNKQILMNHLKKGDKVVHYSDGTIKIIRK